MSKKKSKESEQKKKQKNMEIYRDYAESGEHEAHLDEVRMKSLYNDQNRARIDNNQFFEERSNPLSSKGN